MKKQLLSLSIICSGIAYAQVSIQTEQPKSTLDIVAKKQAGSKDGILVPRVTKADLTSKTATTYSATENSTILYVSEITSVPTTTTSAAQTKITEPGFYYF